MMTTNHPPAEIERLLLYMPSWLGDCVMATPAVRAIRELYPAAELTALSRHSVRPVFEDMPWLDDIMTIQSTGGMFDSLKNNILKYIGDLKRRRFDMAVLFPNSFRSALCVTMSGIPRRVGYERDGRSLLLTDRLPPARVGRRFRPVPAIVYYLELAKYLGHQSPSEAMELFTRPEDDQRCDEMLYSGGYDPGGSRPLVMISPGANFGISKLWYADRFAELADRCVRELDCSVAITGSPVERAIIDRVIAGAETNLIDLTRLGLNLKLLKSVVKRTQVLVTNDTGPRHIAAAFGRPVVTLFGPTDPAWTEIHFEYERQVKVDVFCGPCQKKRCPQQGTKNEHICMKGITVDMVFEQVAALRSLTLSAV